MDNVFSKKGFSYISGRNLQSMKSKNFQRFRMTDDQFAYFLILFVRIFLITIIRIIRMNDFFF